ncbi:uncharacterized protein CTRU02_201995 [Colletotrichum truncatum]|uniref:Uncharacterized protein n=1 Tax=Colletotrichum truncatum TaxID=5467 RepID=A0ACC3ZJ30_COLTU|nr:uncharacterized protein CTRU02_07113 [Colletotrichum truncatum]KAF6791928.1 hypothetical protein CTRU02_07113 [Colletotrichum truncatum]
MELELAPGRTRDVMQRSARQCLKVGGSLAGIRFSGKKRRRHTLDEMQPTDDGCGRRMPTWVCQSECEWAIVSRSGGWACACVGADDG